MVVSYLSAFNLTSLNKTGFFSWIYTEQNKVQDTNNDTKNTLSQVLSVFAEDSGNELFNVYYSFDKDTQIC